MTTDPDPDYTPLRRKTHDKILNKMTIIANQMTTIAKGTEPMTTNRTIYDRIFESTFLTTYRHAENRVIPLSDTSGREPTLDELAKCAAYAGIVARMAELAAMKSRGDVDELEELRAAASDILISFASKTECLVPGHQVARLFRAVHGKDAKLPWDLTNTQESEDK